MNDSTPLGGERQVSGEEPTHISEVLPAVWAWLEESGAIEAGGRR